MVLEYKYDTLKEGDTHAEPFLTLETYIKLFMISLYLFNYFIYPFCGGAILWCFKKKEYSKGVKTYDEAKPTFPSDYDRTNPATA